MKKILQFLFLGSLAISLNIPLQASPAYPFPIMFTQPDGSHIKILLKGDEYSKWAETKDGYALLFDSKGYYEYAKVDERNYMVPSGIIAKSPETRTAEDINFLSNTKLHLTYSKEQLAMLRTAASVRNNAATRSFPTIGNHKLICILIGFQDVPFQKTHEDFENLFNQVNYSASGASGSVKDYYLENSQGQFNLTVTVAGPYVADHNMAYYGANNSNGDDADPRALVTEAVTKADADVNYADFDNDGDGKVDGVYVIYAGYGEEAGASSDAIWAHAWSITPLTLDGKTVSRYSTSAELRGNSGTQITTIGVICHEFGHVLGAPDYYDTDYAESGGQYTGNGNWDIMAGGSWNNHGLSPANHNPYTKVYIYHWASITTISSPQDIEIFPTNTTQANYYRINTKTAGEYYILENRQSIGFDTALPGHGLMVYHVNKDFDAFLSSNKLNAGFPQMIYPVCASNTSIINSTPSSFGNINSDGCPFPGSSSVTEFTDYTKPSEMSWDGYYTGVPITQIAENSTTKSITLSVNETADFYASAITAPVNGPITITDNSFGNLSSTWSWDFGEGANPQTSTDQGPIQVSYSTPGTKTISLTIDGSTTTTKTDYIEVYDPAATAADIIMFNFDDRNLTADDGVSPNLTHAISTTSSGTISYLTGTPTGYMASCSGWDNGANTKAWEISVDASSYNSLTISSSQASSSAGPKNFKIQYKVGSGSWIDVPNSSITLTSTLTQQLDNIALPADCDNQGQVGIRWVMADNTSVGNSQVTSGGLSKIDDIHVKGLLGQGPLGIETNNTGLVITSFPNPFSSSITVSAESPIKNISVYDITGKTILNIPVNMENSKTFGTANFAKGYYLIRVTDANNHVSTMKTVKQ